MEHNGLAQLEALSRYWFGSRTVDEHSMAEAMWLDNRYWQNMTAAVANGISKAFKG